VTIQTYQVPIAEQWRNAENDETFDSEDPFSGEVWAKIPKCSAADMTEAVDAAHQTFKSPSWRGMLPSDRGRLMQNVAQAVLENAEYLAQIEVRDNGKLITEMRAQLNYSARVCS